MCVVVGGGTAGDDAGGGEGVLGVLGVEVAEEGVGFLFVFDLGGGEEGKGRSAVERVGLWFGGWRAALPVGCAG